MGTQVAYAVEDDLIITNECVADGVLLSKITLKDSLSNCWSSRRKSKISEIISDYELDAELFYKSSAVYKQTETIYSPSEYCLKTTEGNLYNVSPILQNTADLSSSSLTISDDWNDDEGYMTITTYAYKTGVDQEGDAIYQIQANYVLHKTFKMRNQDEVTLAHTSNAVLNPDGTINAQQKYHKYYFKDNAYIAPIEIDEDITNNLSPQFPSLSSVQYSFKFPVDHNERNDSSGPSYMRLIESYTNWSVQAQYSIIVSGKTNVQACYFHNEKLFGGNLSIGLSAGPVSISYSVTGACTKYQATPLLLYNE